ncbi:MAG TPA: GPW/gp25 family protein [Candidatus Binataceae bacterium]|nr:GPW/gp25 family protein [Candidatus Binataceae bacterium]
MEATVVVTLNEITSVDWSLKLGAIGEIVEGPADVEQCLQIILSTPKGSDPLRPTFGANLWQYIDFPIDTAVPSLVREVTEAITLWEPRVKLISITAAPDPNVISNLLVNVVWSLQLGTMPTPSKTTTVSLSSGGSQ